VVGGGVSGWGARRGRDQSVVEILALVVLSGAMGAAFGFVAALGMRSNDALIVASGMGLGVGVAAAGPFVIAMGAGSRTEGVLFVGLPTLLTAGLAGLMDPMFALVASTLMYVALSLVWIVWTRIGVKPHRPGTCARCGYDLGGLAAGARCPECGVGRRTLWSSEED